MGIEPLQDAANGRFRRRGAAFRSQPLERLAGESLRPFANRTETPRSRQRRAHRNAHHGAHRMTYAAWLARIDKGFQQIDQAAFSLQRKRIDVDHAGLLC
jgi:hypothetical protein